MKSTQQLLQDIQDAACDSRPLADLLRQCKVLAHRIDSTDLKDWVHRELGGYDAEQPLPKIRALPARLFGDFMSIGWNARHQQVPRSALPEAVYERFSVYEARAGVSHYEELLRGESTLELEVPAPPELAASLTNRVFTNMNCTRVWQSLTRAQFVEMLDNIRTNILSFVLELEEMTPMDDQPDEKISHAYVQKTFNTYIMGGTNNIASGNETALFIQRTVVQGRIETLEECLIEGGLEQSAARELIDIVAGEQPEADGLGPRAKAFITSLGERSLSGVGKATTSALGGLAAKAIAAYYGFPN